MKEELQAERKALTEKWDVLEKQLTERISEKGDEKLMDIFLYWLDIRVKLNENFFKLFEAYTPKEEQKQK